ncbi:MAG: hypothetical protein CSA42_02765 [Gammaproteobacteria bacterium]|nr:MAG: hypothetical protein CSA42_02765 [Gammaproteobacteria bacterium]
MSQLQFLNFTFSFTSIYIVISIFVAIVIWMGGNKLISTKGKMPNSTWFYLGSTLETLWFFVSGTILYFVEMSPIYKVVPVVYMIYSLYGWIYVTRLISTNEIPNSAEDIIIPKPYIEYSQAFAMVFLLLCIGLLVLPWVAPQLI